jgi:hypothetical protein
MVPYQTEALAVLVLCIRRKAVEVVVTRTALHQQVEELVDLVVEEEAVVEVELMRVVEHLVQTPMLAAMVSIAQDSTMQVAVAVEQAVLVVMQDKLVALVVQTLYALVLRLLIVLAVTANIITTTVAQTPQQIVEVEHREQQHRVVVRMVL